MTILRLNGSTSGYAEVAAPAAAGNNRLTLPTGNGTNGQQLITDGTGATTWSDGIVLQTVQATTSGTSFGFTGIPSWAKRITVNGASVSTTGTSLVIVQLGTSAGYTTSGYLGGTNGGGLVGSGIAVDSFTNAAAVRQFQVVLTLLTGNQWVGQSFCQRSDTASNDRAGGSVTLSGTLDRVRLTTVIGTDAFDSGSVNIMYEG